MGELNTIDLRHHTSSQLSSRHWLWRATSRWTLNWPRIWLLRPSNASNKWLQPTNNPC